MDDFRFDWDAPSSVWVRCDICGERIGVDWGQPIASVLAGVEEHEHREGRSWSRD